FHLFGFAEGRGDGACVEMIASNHDGRLDFPFFYELVHGESELRALAITEPADARGEALEFNALARQVDPALQNLIIWEELEHQVIRDRNVRRLTRQRHPTERPAPFAKQRAD